MVLKFSYSISHAATHHMNYIHLMNGRMQLPCLATRYTVSMCCLLTISRAHCLTRLLEDFDARYRWLA